MPANVPGYLRLDVPANSPDFGVRLPCPQCNVQKLSKLGKRTGQLEGVLKMKRFSNFIPLGGGSTEGLQASMGFVKNPIGWLTLHGTHGPGKTHLCAAIANELGPENCFYFNTPDLTSSFTDDFEATSKLIKRLERVPVLILDELDKAHIQKWTRSQMQRIFDHRQRNNDKYGLVIATNVAPENYDGDLGFIGSRMRFDIYKCIEMSGDNRNRSQALKTISETSDQRRRQ